MTIDADPDEIIGHCNCCHDPIIEDDDLSPLGPVDVLICIDCADKRSPFVMQFEYEDD
jgi:hypothetical protein